MRSTTGLILDLLRMGLDPAQIVTRLEMRAALKGCATALDVGCGPSSTLHLIGFKHLAGLEGYPPSLELAKQRGTHDELLAGDARDLLRYFKPGQFDACVALDVIEHLPKEEGLKMARDMEAIAGKKVVLLTPTGFLRQAHTERDDLQEHLSGWEVAEMRGMGYRVVGILGPKRLRKEYHNLRWRPKVFWGLVSLLGHIFWTRWHPESAAAILCVKEADT